jgi:glycerophosphoryl diester phosphodiesterase
LAAIAVLVLAYVVLALLARTPDEHPFFDQTTERPLVMAHRGGKGLWPENTLYAFEQAVAMGVDVLEMDFHSTADGVLVLMHDDTVDRTTNGTGPIQALTLEEVKALDAGYHWSSDDGQSHPYRGQGITVPTVEEVFQAFADMPLNIEIKPAEPSLAEPFCQLIRDYEMTERVLVASFHQEVMKAFRAECPEVATSAGENEIIVLFALSKLLLERAYTLPAEAVQVPEYRGNLHVITTRLVKAAHNRNLEVHAWTINAVEDMEHLLDLGVDGIITDYPDLLIALLDG